VTAEELIIYLSRLRDCEVKVLDRYGHIRPLTEADLAEVPPAWQAEKPGIPRFILLSAD
jgi:hypothetical protein